MERSLSREHLVQDRAEREDVAAGVDELAADLLGRHVADGAHDEAGLGARRCRREAGRARAGSLGLRELGQAEVEDLHAAVARDEDVLGLQVPVDDALGVGGGESRGDLEPVTDGAARRECSARETRAQRLAFEQLLDDVRRAVVRTRCRRQR